MATITLTTAEDLAAMPADDNRYELIRGGLVEMSPAGAEHGELELEMGALMRNHVVPLKLGKVYGAETGFILSRDPDTVLAPDVAFVRADRLTGRRRDRRGFLALVPDLIVEVISPSERPDKVADKLRDYLDAGVRLAWLLYPDPPAIAVHAPGRPVQMLYEGDWLDGEDVLPGFRVAVTDLFQE